MNTKIGAIGRAITFCGLVYLASSVSAIGQDPEKPSPSKTELNQKLAEYLTNTLWKGSFTISGKDVPPKPELYEIKEAIKADEGDYWNLIVRIKYGDKDLTLPLPPIEIKWAGQTPVITLDALTIPGMGTFDARVVIRSGQYAGVWKHDQVGGHLFGTIEKMEADQQE